MYSSFYSRHFGRDLQVGRPLFEVLFTMTSPTTEAWKPSFRTSTPLDPLKTNNNLTSYFMWDTSIYQHQALWTGPTLNPCGLSTVPHVCWLNPMFVDRNHVVCFLCKIILWLLVESCRLYSWKIPAIRTTVLGLVQCLFNTIHYVSLSLTGDYRYKSAEDWVLDTVSKVLPNNWGKTVFMHNCWWWLLTP